MLLGNRIPSGCFRVAVVKKKRTVSCSIEMFSLVDDSDVLFNAIVVALIQSISLVFEEVDKEWGGKKGYDWKYWLRYA